MERKLDNEVKQLTKMGMPEDMAFIIACAKIGKPELASELLQEVKDTQDDIAKELANFVPLETTLEKSSLVILEK